MNTGKKEPSIRKLTETKNAKRDASAKENWCQPRKTQCDPIQVENEKLA